MPVPQRRPSEVTLQLVPLLLVAMGLVTSNPSATILDDEARTLNRATQPVHDLLAQFFSSNSPSFPRPPLFEILVHYWLRWAGGTFAYLRIPSILFFIAGLFLLGRTARHWMGGKGGVAVIWAGALWPLGFHYGRLAIAPTLAFFLLCGLTLAYQKLQEERSGSRWITLVFFCAALTWTSYLGWAVVACIAIDLAVWLRKSPHQKAALGANAVPLAGSVVILGAAFLPFVNEVRHVLGAGTGARHAVQPTLANLGFSIYSLFVSESVAPWYWQFSVPAAIAVVLCVALMVRWTRGPARRLLLFSGCLVGGLALSGFLNMSTLMVISPWVLLPIGIAIEQEKPQWANLALAAAILIIGGIGWYGIYARRYYSAQQFIEPWQQVSDDASRKIRNGAMLIADEPSLLFYITYDLQIPRVNGPWRYQGSVIESVHYPPIFSPVDWVASGRPRVPSVLLVRGAGDWREGSQIDGAAKELDQSCGAITSRLMVRDEGYAWKERLLPDRGDPLWRIEVREYACGSSNSNQGNSPPTR